MQMTQALASKAQRGGPAGKAKALCQPRGCAARMRLAIAFPQARSGLWRPEALSRPKRRARQALRSRRNRALAFRRSCRFGHKRPCRFAFGGCSKSSHAAMPARKRLNWAAHGRDVRQRHGLACRAFTRAALPSQNRLCAYGSVFGALMTVWHACRKRRTYLLLSRKAEWANQSVIGPISSSTILATSPLSGRRLHSGTTP